MSAYHSLSECYWLPGPEGRPRLKTQQPFRSLHILPTSVSLSAVKAPLCDVIHVLIRLSFTYFYMTSLWHHALLVQIKIHFVVTIKKPT